MNKELALMTGVDIPIVECQLILHQPTIKEISMIGEEIFFLGIQLLTISTENIKENIQISNFDLLMEILSQDKSKKNILINVLTLLFLNYSFVFTPKSIIFKNKQNETLIIDENNFIHLQKVLEEVFCLKNKKAQNDFNPEGIKAQEIANKLQRARERVAAQKAKNNNNQATLAQYLSIITVGIHSMSLQDAINLTIYQLYDLIERMNLYFNWDIDLRSRLVPFSSGKKEPLDNWMKVIH